MLENSFLSVRFKKQKPETLDNLWIVIMYSINGYYYMHLLTIKVMAAIYKLIKKIWRPFFIWHFSRKLYIVHIWFFEQIWVFKGSILVLNSLCGYDRNISINTIECQNTSKHIGNYPKNDKCFMTLNTDWCVFEIT